MAGIPKIQKTKSKINLKRSKIATNFLRNLLILLFFTHHVFGADDNFKQWEKLSDNEKKEYAPQYGTYLSPNTDKGWKSIYTNQWSSDLPKARDTLKKSFEETKTFFKDKKLDDIYEYVQIPNDSNCIHHAIAEGMLRYIKNEEFIIIQMKEHIKNIALTEDVEIAKANLLDYEKQDKLHVLLRYLAYFHMRKQMKEGEFASTIELTFDYVIKLTYITMLPTGNTLGGEELAIALEDLEFQVSQESESSKIRFKLTRIHSAQFPKQVEIKEQEKEIKEQEKEIILWNRGLEEIEDYENHLDLLIRKKKADDDVLNPNINLQKSNQINKEESKGNRNNMTTNKTRDNRKNITTNKKKEDSSWFLYYIIMPAVLCIGIFVFLYFMNETVHEYMNNLYNTLMGEDTKDTQANSEDTSPSQSLSQKPDKILSLPSNKSFSPPKQAMIPCPSESQNTITSTQTLMFTSNQVSTPTLTHNTSKQLHQGRETSQNDAITIYPPKNTNSNSLNF